MNLRQLAAKCDETGPENATCHGTLECLRSGSTPWAMSPVMRVYQRFASYLTWWSENLGWRKTLNQIVGDGFRRKPDGVAGKGFGMVRATDTGVNETLGLQPGELVEVRPIDEILATLNRERRCRGLLWMTEMRKYCGKRYRVYKRVERIMLETNGELRRIKNTVLLEGVTCDGTAFGGCNRSCFHFWREVWLRRVPVGQDERGGDVFSATEDSHRSGAKNHT